MISHREAKRAALIVDSSNAVEILISGYRTSSRGRPANRHGLRLMLIGLLLSISKNGRATLTAAHRTLTEDLPLDVQLELGVIELVNETREVRVSIDDFYNLGKTLSSRLAYTSSSAPDVTDEVRDHRHATIKNYCDSMMDVFKDLVPTSSTVAIDATNVWSWGRAFSNKERAAIEALQAASIADPNDTVKNVADVVEAMSSSTTAKRRDVDAAWGTKTAKNGKKEVFFGYHEHTLVLVADDCDEGDTVPALITRFELTSASTDVVDVTLDLIDRSPTPLSDIIIDRHYHYKKVERWKRELIRRGVEQHLDLRADEQGFTESDRLRWAAGEAHCPATPDVYATIDKPGLNVADDEWAAFHDKIDKRASYAMRPHDRGDGNGTQRLGCPALAGKVGCPLRAGMMQAAMEAALPIVENPPSADDAEGLPACCAQQTVRITPPESQLKLKQPHRWGSPSWHRTLGRRSRVEGSYGIRKNPSTENVRRGHFQKFGLVWVHIVMTLANASYNVRILEKWCERHPDSPAGDHPLIRAYDTAEIGSVHVTAAEYQTLVDARDAVANVA